MKSRSQKIREWLVEQDGPRKPGEIAAGIGKPRCRLVGLTIQQMRKDGYLVREKGDGCWLYSVGKPVIRTRHLSAEERRRSKNRKERERAHAKGRRSWAQYQADVAAQREQRASDLAAAAPRRAGKADKPIHDASRKQHVVVRVAEEKTVVPQRKSVPVETVEQWMARTGKKPQVLPFGAVSNPIGPHFNGAKKAA